MKLRTGSFLTFLLVFAILCGCGAKQEVTGTVLIEGPGVRIQAEVTVTAASPTAADAFLQACKDQKAAYTYQDGMFDGFGGLESTETDGWLFYIGDALADRGAGETELSDGFAVSFRYQNYAEAFGLS